VRARAPALGLAGAACNRRRVLLGTPRPLTASGRASRRRRTFWRRSIRQRALLCGRLVSGSLAGLRQPAAADARRLAWDEEHWLGAAHAASRLGRLDARGHVRFAHPAPAGGYSRARLDMSTVIIRAKKPPHKAKSPASKRRSSEARVRVERGRR
jgi:hypothetical protein